MIKLVLRNPELVSKSMTEVESNPWCFVHFDSVEEMFEAIENSTSTNNEYVHIKKSPFDINLLDVFY